MLSQEHPIETTTTVPIINSGTGATIYTGGPSFQVGLPKAYCESVADFAECARRYTEEQQAKAQTGRPMNGREIAHSQGEAYSNLEGRQPIFALLGYQDIRNLEGRLLTILDTISNDRQCRALKDLIRNALWFDWAPNLDTDDAHCGKPDLSR